jgi:hypothetical protein
MFRTEAVEVIKTHVKCSIELLRKSYGFRGNYTKGSGSARFVTINQRVHFLNYSRTK